MVVPKGAKMAVTAESMLDWCQVLLNVDNRRPRLSLSEYLANIPRLGSLSDLPRGTCVLVRGDVDAKPGPRVGDGDIRLRSMSETLELAGSGVGSRSCLAISAVRAKKPCKRSRPGWAKSCIAKCRC